MRLSFKYEKEFREIQAIYYQPWMGDDDRAEYDKLMLERAGGPEGFDRRIDEGIANGYLLDTQMMLAKQVAREQQAAG